VHIAALHDRNESRHLPCLNFLLADGGLGSGLIIGIHNGTPHIVKFDKAFLSELTTQQSKSRILLPSLISLCHELGYQSMCEGVETSEQVEFLSHTKCRFGQGYFYGKAMPLSEVLALSQGEPLVLVHPPRHPA
jgi:EAL domain-containing protein (putative c-di-GMP-specific phosphodiesterase class I)